MHNQFVGWITAQRYPPKPLLVEKPQAAFSTLHKRFGSRTVPVRRPSAGAAKQVSRQDAEKGPLGHGWPCGTCLRSGTGAREVERSETRMPGGLLLLTFLGQARKVRRPAGRNQNHQTTSIISTANNTITSSDCQSSNKPRHPSTLQGGTALITPAPRPACRHAIRRNPQQSGSARNTPARHAGESPPGYAAAHGRCCVRRSADPAWS